LLLFFIALPLGSNAQFMRIVDRFNYVDFFYDTYITGSDKEMHALVNKEPPFDKYGLKVIKKEMALVIRNNKKVVEKLLKNVHYISVVDRLLMLTV
jgi:hypothetical protein